VINVRYFFTQLYVFFCFLYRCIIALLIHGLNKAFARIPIGRHTVCACFALSAVNISVSLLFTSIIESIMPFQVIFIAILGMIMGNIMYGGIKFIPVKNKRTDQTKKWAIGT
jgi:ABC-type enterochelin transport system permease subunit